MKPSGRLKPGEPLRRGKPLRSTTALKSGGPLPYASPRTISERVTRWGVIAEVRMRDKTCQAATSVPSVACGGRLDVHEVWTRGRHPGSHLHAEAAILCCREHHAYITEHPAEAQELGLVVSSSEPRPWAEP